MPFPKTIPKKIAENGTVVALFRFANKDSAAIRYWEIYLYLVVDDNGRYRRYSACRHAPGSRLSLAGYFSCADRVSCEEAIDTFSRFSHVQINFDFAEGKILEHSTAEKEIIEVLERTHPELRIHIDLLRSGWFVFPATHAPSSPEPQTEPASSRFILSRSDWMALHYPQHAAA